MIVMFDEDGFICIDIFRNSFVICTLNFLHSISSDLVVFTFNYCRTGVHFLARLLAYS